MVYRLAAPGFDLTSKRPTLLRATDPNQLPPRCISPRDEWSAHACFGASPPAPFVGGDHVDVNIRAVRCAEIREAKHAAAVAKAIDGCSTWELRCHQFEDSNFRSNGAFFQCKRCPFLGRHKIRSGRSLIHSPQIAVTCLRRYRDTRRLDDVSWQLSIVRSSRNVHAAGKGLFSQLASRCNEDSRPLGIRSSDTQPSTPLVRS